MTLREQNIGRGLRLPYGKRTGNDAVDRLMIVSHDNFNEILEAANEEISIIKRENIILAMQAKAGMFKHMPMSKQRELADKYIELLRIKVSDREQLIRNLSGGNQQKVIIARWLATQPRLLILDEPTRGIDVGTKSEIEALAVRLAKEQGMSVVFISGEMGEMVRTCSRIMVIRDHEKITELNGDEISTAHIMQAIAGDYHGSN